MPLTYQDGSPSTETFEALARLRPLPPCGAGIGCRKERAAHVPFTMAFVINIDHAFGGERMKLISEQLNSSGVPWKLWPGVIPTNETYDQFKHLLPKSFLKSPALFEQAIAQPRSRAVLGNYLSHLSLWNYLVHHRQASHDDVYLILEDDLWLAPDWLGRMQRGMSYVPPDWEVTQHIWFGSYYGSASVNQWVDKARNDALDLDSAVYPRRWTADDPRLTYGLGAYLGLQATLSKISGLGCLLTRVPQLSVRRVTSVDVMSRDVNCVGRYALHAGVAEDFNWGNPDAIGWHTAHPWMQSMQRRIYDGLSPSRRER